MTQNRNAKLSVMGIVDCEVCMMVAKAISAEH